MYVKAPIIGTKSEQKIIILIFLEMDGFKEFVQLKEVRQWMELKAVELVIDGLLRIRTF
jgi:hypothetical protein